MLSEESCCRLYEVGRFKDDEEDQDNDEEEEDALDEDDDDDGDDIDSLLDSSSVDDDGMCAVIFLFNVDISTLYFTVYKDKY